MDKELFVQNVKAYCALKGVKPTAACIESGVGKDMITNLIKRGTVPSVERVQTLAQYLGCTVSDLLGEEGNAQAATPKGSGLSEEFTRIFENLTPENQNKIIAEMLKRQREQ